MRTQTERDRIQADLAPWIGRTETVGEVIAAAPVAALSATLDRDDPPPAHGDPLPPGAHWLFFNGAAPTAALSVDGHAAKGHFMPPIPFPRRMWVGGRLRFERPLCIGEAARRTTEIADIRIKAGRSGDLCFVTLVHTVEGEAGVALVEEQDLAYREAARPGEAQSDPLPAPADADWTREIRPGPVLLFRFSALTFNGHRIHYDRPYTTEVEGYPGLLVHGPLLATLLLDLLRRHADRPVARFEYRALRPVFDTGPFTIGGRLEEDGCALWALDNDGFLATTARAAFA